MTFKNTTIQKLISFFIIIGIFTPTLSIFFIPKKADAIVDVFVEPGVIWNAYLIDQTINDNIIAVSVVTETTVAVKETFWRTIIKEALMIIARRMINKMTQATINWINSGFHGNPAFIDNPRSFFGDIVKYEVNSLIRTFTNTARFPFGRNFAKNTINSYQRQLEDNMEYTLSQVTDDRVLLNDLQNDFNTGGWAGFLINTQYPQNNYIGFQMLATKELAKRLDGTIQNNAQKINTTLQQGMGFLSQQTCPSNPAYNLSNKSQFKRPEYVEPPYRPPVYGPVDDDTIPVNYDKQWEILDAVARAEWEKTNVCPGGLQNITPGSVVGDRIKDALGSKGRQGELAAAMGNSIGAIFDALLNQLLDKALGLISLNKRQEKEGETVTGRVPLNKDPLGGPDLVDYAPPTGGRGTPEGTGIPGIPPNTTPGGPGTYEQCVAGCRTAADTSDIDFDSCVAIACNIINEPSCGEKIADSGYYGSELSCSNAYNYCPFELEINLGPTKDCRTCCARPGTNTSYSVTLCNNSGSCKPFSTDNPDIYGSGGPMYASSISAPAIQNAGLFVQLCMGTDFQGCWTVDQSYSDLRTTPLGLNPPASIRITQPTP